MKKNIIHLCKNKARSFKSEHTYLNPNPKFVLQTFIQICTLHRLYIKEGCGFRAKKCLKN